jgi:hypothetical protein
MVFLDTPASMVAHSGLVSKRAFVEGTLRFVSVALCKGNGCMYTDLLQTLVQSHRRAYSPGVVPMPIAVPIAVPGDDYRVVAVTGRGTWGCVSCVRFDGRLSAWLLRVAWVLLPAGLSLCVRYAHPLYDSEHLALSWGGETCIHLLPHASVRLSPSRLQCAGSI